MEENLSTPGPLPQLRRITLSKALTSIVKAEMKHVVCNRNLTYTFLCFFPLRSSPNPKHCADTNEDYALLYHGLAGLGVKWFNLLLIVIHILNCKFADEHVKLVNVDFACHFVKHRLTFPNSDPPSTPWAKATAGTREETRIPYLSLALAMYSFGSR